MDLSSVSSKSFAAKNPLRRETLVAKRGVNGSTFAPCRRKIGSTAPASITAGAATASATCVLTSDRDQETMVFSLPNLRKDADPKNVTAIILGGGAGSGLFPLTSTIAAPAVPVAGCYRLIDIPMSNCLNSGINKVYIMTQFNSASLNRHIYRTYQGGGMNFSDGFVEVLAAMQTQGQEGKNWFQGTADAVRKFCWIFEDYKNRDIENVLILSGDQLYRMNYMELVQKHIDQGSDITISCVPVEESRASEYGLVKVSNTGQVVEFSEKPKGGNLKSMKVDTNSLRLSREDALKYPYIASMGVYVFKREVLLNLLTGRYPSLHDFGSDILPLAVKDHNVQTYYFNDYWDDIGTIKSFFDANMALTDEVPKFQLYDPKTPFFTSPLFLPPTRHESCKIRDSIISHGCFMNRCTVDHCIIGVRSRLDSGCELKDTLMMGSDFYETEEEIALLQSENKVPIGVGRDTKIRNCIIDMNARIGNNVVISNSEGVEEADRPNEGFYIRSGITVVLKNATIVDGMVI